MPTDDSGNTLNAFSRWQQRQVGVVVFAINVCLLVCFGLCYQAYCAALDDYNVEGLVLMLVIAFGMATVAAPFFVDSMAGNPTERAKNCREAVKLHFAVTGITFGALSLVFFVIWLFGWIRALGRLGLHWFKRWLLGPA